MSVMLMLLETCYIKIIMLLQKSSHVCIQNTLNKILVPLLHNYIKNAMSIFFIRIVCILHFNQAGKPTPINMRICQIHACWNITEKWICWKCVARKFGFFNVSISNNRYFQLTSSSGTNASDWVARGPGFESRLCQGFLCLVLLLLLL